MHNKIQIFKSGILFLVCLLGMAVIYNYPAILFKKPQSIHNWRQSDCTSLTLNYYQDGMNFFKPHTHNLLGNASTNCYAAPSEIPLSYYVTAILYFLFGVKEYILRGIHLLIFLTGLFYFYKLNYLISQQFLLSIIISIILFTSPVLVYYGNNFLTDASALSFSIISFYYLYKNIQFGKNKDLILFIVFASLAGAFKISGLLLLCSFFCTIFIIRKNKEALLWSAEKKITKTLFVAIAFIPAILWALYAKWYNTFYDNPYFSTQMFPIWEMDKDFIQSTLDNIKKNWIKEYASPGLYLCWASMLIYNVIFWKQSNLILRWINVWLGIGVVFYILAWFATLKHHDYYVINLFIFIVSNSIVFLETSRRLNQAWVKNYLLKIALILLTLYSISYAKQKHEERYKSPMNDYFLYEDFYTIRPVLDSLGIGIKDTVVSLPQPSHTSLYLMNVIGTTSAYEKNLEKDSIFDSIKKGASYLFLCGSEIRNHKAVRPFTKHKIFVYKNISIYDLKPFRDLDKIELPIRLIDKLICPAEEKISSTQLGPKSLLGISAGNADAMTNERKKSGNTSLKLTKEKPFGFTCQFDSVAIGDFFKVEVSFFSKNNIGRIIAQFNDPNEFYFSFQEPKYFKEHEWYTSTCEIQVLKKPADAILKIYIWNPTEEDLFCDDLKIERYKIIEN